MKNIKKQIIITATAVFIGSANFAQNVTLTTQTQVDAWTATSVTGFLSITSGNVYFQIL